MNRIVFFLISICIMHYIADAQENPVLPSPWEDRQKGFEIAEELRSSSRFRNLEAECVGPSVFSGRVSEIAVNAGLPSHFFVAYASGGLWYTQNNGTTFESLFDDQASMTIGAIAVNWQDSIIWVGTGEVNSSRSSYAGTGVYRSDDWGKSWQHLGLTESHHIGRIVLDNEDRNIVHIAVLGHLYSDNAERGVYSTFDGGKTWEQTLFISNKAGAVDLVRHPNNNNVLLAAIWQRERKAWNFLEGGAGSGIYESLDNGRTWSIISKDTGFPEGENVGRIGLSIAPNGDYLALVDNYERRPSEGSTNKKGKQEQLEKDDFKSMTSNDFKALENEKLEQFLRDNRFPTTYSAERVKNMVVLDSILPSDLSNYLEDANRLLFDTEVIGAEVYRRSAQDSHWVKTHDDYLDYIYYSYGYYFGQIRVNPLDSDMLYIMGVPLLKSEDGGKSWLKVNHENVHVDHHALWCNPNQMGHLINGNDGGINISYDNGDSWIKCNDPDVGQFYTVNVDYDSPYNIYGGTQDNGVWKGKHNARTDRTWQMDGDYPFDRIMGGDGMKIEIDPRNSAIVYTGYQFGNYYKLDLEKEDGDYITPKHELGDSPYRWNWQSPILLSQHNPDIFYMGANKVLRSMDGAKSFDVISSDLTQGGKKGDVAYGTLTTLSESKFGFEVLYTGSDDGKVFVTRDAGSSWNDISEGLPQYLWVSRIEASHHVKSKAYTSLNGYRWDDWTPYIYKTDDFGLTWIDISSNLPHQPVNVIKEDPEHPNILYAGLDSGLYISFDDGKSWESLQMNIPNVPIHDLVIQTEEDHLVIATHGRSFYIIDLEMIRLTQTVEGLFIHPITVQHSKRWGKKPYPYAKAPKEEYYLSIYSKSATTGTYVLQEGKKVVHESQINLKAGWNSISMPVMMNKTQEYMDAETYAVKVKTTTGLAETTLTLEGKD